MNNTKLVAATIVAVAAICGFALLVIYMLRMTSADDKVWTRTAYLLNGAEALAFSGAGFLFGKEVHRQQAEKAENRADEATKEAKDLGKRAATGEALAEAIKAKALSKPLGSPGARILSAPQAEESLADLIAMATKLYP